METITDKKLLALLTKLHDEKGLDFTQYKPATLLRRIGSRLSKHGLRSYDEYIKLLEAEPKEYDELINALTINVTDFFRNPESFGAIDKIVIPRVIASKRAHDHWIIRAWSCGCSTGDEPYSLAMVFSEKLGSAIDRFRLTIIGSDIDNKALDTAKNTAYSAERLQGIPKPMVSRYFEKLNENEFRVKYSLKRYVQFYRHDIVKDRPFMLCDIILCRNLLIYFNKQLQEETLLKFYECLNPGGYLILGMVESLAGSAEKRFEKVDNKLRIYRRPEREGAEVGNGVLSQADIDKIVKEMLG